MVLSAAGAIGLALKPSVPLRWRELAVVVLQTTSFLLYWKYRLSMAQSAAGWGGSSGWRQHLAGAHAWLHHTHVLQLLIYFLIQPLTAALAIPVNTLCLAAVISHNHEVCSTQLFTSSGARQLVGSMHGHLSLIPLAILPLSAAHAAQHTPHSECMAVLSYVQLLFGWALPTLMLLRHECACFRAYGQRTSQEQQERDAALIWPRQQVLAWLCRVVDSWSDLPYMAAFGLATVCALAFEVVSGLAAKAGGSTCSA